MNTTLPLNCANNAQFNVSLNLSVSQFLEIENIASMAHGLAIARSYENLGGESPTIIHVKSLAKDFGVLLPTGAPGFATAVSLALAAYINHLWAPTATTAEASGKADSAYDALIALVGPRSADRIATRTISTAAGWTQDGIHSLKYEMKAGLVKFDPKL